MLTNKEQGRLIELESVISKSVRAFLDVGEALVEIRDHKLWRSRFESFEEYCESRWSFKRSRASQIINAFEVAKSIQPTSQGGVTTVTGSREVAFSPANEGQVRPLISLPPAERQAVWDEAVKLASGRQPTSTDVEAAKVRVLTRQDVAAMPVAEQVQVVEDVEKAILKAGRAEDRKDCIEKALKLATKLHKHVVKTLGDTADGIRLVADMKAVVNKLERMSE